MTDPPWDAWMIPIILLVLIVGLLWSLGRK
jgi:hypothetical protein